MKTLFRIKAIAGGFVFVVMVGISAKSEAAQWLYAHGNAARIQDTSVCTYAYFGWGLDLDLTPGKHTWIHIPVPAQAGGTVGARYIRVKAYLGSSDCELYHIDIYNGNTIVSTPYFEPFKSGWNDVKIDMGKKLLFSRGMSISFYIVANSDASASHQFIFAAAGAYFQ